MSDTIPCEDAANVVAEPSPAPGSSTPAQISRARVPAAAGAGGAVAPAPDSQLTLPPETDVPAAARSVPGVDPLLGCLAILCELFGHPTTPEALGAGFALRPDGRVEPAQLAEIAQAHGMAAKLAPRRIEALDVYTLPVIALLKNGDACVVTDIVRHPDGNGECSVVRPDTGMARHVLPLAKLQARQSGVVMFVKPRAELDERGDFDEQVSPTRWFWDILWRYKSYYLHVALATFVVNILTLAGSLFTMNVYDRVVPNQAYETLWVLAVGTVVAAGFEFGARMLRAWLTDVAGKKADLVMSSVLFRRVLGLRLDQKPGSAGSFANTLRDFESVRDFVTSATLLTVADLPFVLFFIAIIALIAGPVALVPLVAMVLVLVATLAAQVPLARLMTRYMKGMSRKQAIAVEAIEGLEALKANRAEAVMQSRWEHASAQMAAFSAESRMVSAWLNGFVNIVQQVDTVVLVFWGVYRIHANELTMGGLIAAVILAGRAIAPVSQIAALGIRFQQARTALTGLNQLMQREQDRDPARTYVHLPRASGAMTLTGITHRYVAEQANPVLDRLNIQVQAGERIAILGRVGSGKSTLLRIAAGLLPPSEGTVSYDGLDVRQVEPADVRASMAYAAQDARLFFGTLRQNIVLAERAITAQRLGMALRLTGLDRVVAAHPKGLDLPIGENGQGLSGGQRQLVALARLFARDPSIVLLDEPTSAMDQMTENQIMEGLKLWLEGRTMLMVTHRMQWLPLASRIIVMDAGRIVADGPREQVLAQLAKGIQLRPAGATA